MPRPAGARARTRLTTASPVPASLRAAGGTGAARAAAGTGAVRVRPLVGGRGIVAVRCAARWPGKRKNALVGSRREARSQPVAVVRTTHRNRFDRPPPGRARGATRLAGSTRHTNRSECALPTFLRPTSPRSHIRRPCAAAGGEDEGRRHQSRRERHRTARGGEPAPPAATPAEDMAKRAEPNFRYAMGYEYIRTQTLIRHLFGDIWVYLAGTWPNCISD